MDMVTRSGMEAHKVNRVGEMVLIILGGVFGLMSSGFAVSAGIFASVLKNSHASEFLWRGVFGFLVSVLALVLLSFLSSHSRVAGWLLIGVAVAGFLCVGYFYILPGILLFIAGLMCLLRGHKRMIAMSWGGD